MTQIRAVLLNLRHHSLMFHGFSSAFPLIPRIGQRFYAKYLHLCICLHIKRLISRPFLLSLIRAVTQTELNQAGLRHFLVSELFSVLSGGAVDPAVPDVPTFPTYPVADLLSPDLYLPT